jgi:deoxyribodipyrimidine photo-lyase
VDRCDPEGAFIKHWLPELAHLSPQQLGSPPPVKGYPPPILDYKQARQRRVQQLEAQRGRFLQHDNIVPYLASLPKDLTPFGSDRYHSETAWAQSTPAVLFPEPLPLADLDAQQSRDLRSWFVAHVNIAPPKLRKRPLPSPGHQLALNL